MSNSITASCSSRSLLYSRKSRLASAAAHRRQRPLWKRSVTTCALATAALTTASSGVVVSAFQTTNNAAAAAAAAAGRAAATTSGSFWPRAATAVSSSSPTLSTAAASLASSSSSAASGFVNLQHSEFSPQPGQAGSSSSSSNKKPPVVFLHGLLGNRRNFSSIGRSLAAQLEQPRRIVAVDLRNHGDTAKQQLADNCPLVKNMAYQHMAADIVAFLDAQKMEQAVLVGHSMGGKLAQAVSLLHPDRVDGLVVLDIAPVAYTTQDAHWKAVVDILHVLKDIPGPQDVSSTDQQQPLTKRQVETLLKPTIPDPALRAFLLTNWNAATGEWSIPVADICSQIDHLADFDIPADGVYQYEGDCFLIHGGQSRFVRHSYMPTIAQYFPNHLLTTVKSAGHWVHAEAPQDTTALLKRFLDR